MIYAITYMAGFLLTLIVLARFGKRLGFDRYDPPHEDYYDDWESNAHAYVAFSALWPLFVSLHTGIWSYGIIVRLTDKIILK